MYLTSYINALILWIETVSTTNVFWVYHTEAPYRALILPKMFFYATQRKCERVEPHTNWKFKQTNLDFLVNNNTISHGKLKSKEGIFWCTKKSLVSKWTCVCLSNFQIREYKNIALSKKLNKCTYIYDYFMHKNASA